MPVSRQEPLDETRRAFIAGVEDFVGPDNPLAKGIRDASFRTEALPVFTLTLRDVLDGEGIRAAQPAGWRFMTMAAREAVATDVMDVPEENRQRITSLSRDPRLASVIQFMEKIPDLPEVQPGGAYELLLLRIPAVLVDAFWLKSATGAGDLIIPVLSAASELTRWQVYEANEFFKLTRPLAEGFLEFDKTGGGPAGVP